MAARILNIILALLIFISSTGFTVNKHFCQNELKTMAIFVQPMSCHDLAKMPASCPMHQKQHACNHEGGADEKKDCCKNESEYYVLDQDQEVQNTAFPTFKNLALLATIFVVSHIDLPTMDNAKLHYLNYKPPLINCDFQVFLQTFLL